MYTNQYEIKSTDYAQRTMQAVAAYSKLFPLRDNEPYFCVRWSESPAFNDTLTAECAHDAATRYSIAAADAFLRWLDELYTEQYPEGGYDKTAFTVHFTDRDGEPGTYSGRYDVGDCDGGLIAHIRQYAEILKRPQYAECAQEAEQLLALCDLLEKSTNESIYAIE